MMKITGLSHLFKWENLHNWWLTKYFFAPLYMNSLNQYFSTSFATQMLHWTSVVTQDNTKYNDLSNVKNIFKTFKLILFIRYL